MTEVTGTVSTTFMGLTVGCARCHDHKIDPIPQDDYYRLQAFFEAAEPAALTLASSGEQQQWREQSAQIQKVISDLEDKRQALLKPARERVQEKSHTMPTDKEVQASLSAEEKRELAYLMHQETAARNQLPYCDAGGMGHPGFGARGGGELHIAARRTDAKGPSRGAACAWHLAGCRIERTHRFRDGEIHGTSTHPGQVAGRSRTGADGARHREPFVGPSFRARHRGHTKQLRRSGPRAHASGVAGLAGAGLDRRRVEIETPAPPHGALTHLPAGEHRIGRHRWRRTKRTSFSPASSASA